MRGRLQAVVQQRLHRSGRALHCGLRNQGDAFRAFIAAGVETHIFRTKILRVGSPGALPVSEGRHSLLGKILTEPNP